MALTAFTSTITHTALNANFDDKTATLKANALLGGKDWTFHFRWPAVLAGSDESLRSVAFTAPDDLELRDVGVTSVDTTAARTASVALTVDGGDDDYLLETTVSVSVTTVIGTAHGTRSDYRTTTGTRVRLLKGVRYRLTATQSAGTGVVQGYVQCRTGRRVA